MVEVKEDIDYLKSRINFIYGIIDSNYNVVDIVDCIYFNGWDNKIKEGLRYTNYYEKIYRFKRQCIIITFQNIIDENITNDLCKQLQEVIEYIYKYRRSSFGLSIKFELTKDELIFNIHKSKNDNFEYKAIIFKMKNDKMININYK